MLQIKSVTKRFNDFIAVDDVSFEVKKGEMLGFLGGNGAGKTTTFRMILGLTSITEGEITLNGKKINQEMYSNIGYLPEERGLHPKLKVEEELKYLAKLKGLDKKSIQESIDYWLERFNISENRNIAIENLSKGNQQKIQLLASLIHNPDLLILDEPFSGLDPVNVELLKDAVKELNNEGTTIIFSSHRMEHVEELCDSVCILKKGNIVQKGAIKTIKRSYPEKKVILDSDIDMHILAGIEGILNITKQKDVTIITIKNEEVAKKIFYKVTSNGYIRTFKLQEPSLNEIFIDSVGDAR